jgi:iron complex outermembrane receptor protein
LEGSQSGWLESLYLTVGGETNAKQNRLDTEDFAPEGYTLVNLSGGVVVPLGEKRISLDLQLRNVFDEAYASFLSRYKTYALDPGRNFIVRVSTEF